MTVPFPPRLLFSNNSLSHKSANCPWGSWELGSPTVLQADLSVEFEKKKQLELREKRIKLCPKQYREIRNVQASLALFRMGDRIYADRMGGGKIYPPPIRNRVKCRS